MKLRGFGHEIEEIYTSWKEVTGSFVMLRTVS